MSELNFEHNIVKNYLNFYFVDILLYNVHSV